jgi:hypothetical protein
MKNWERSAKVFGDGPVYTTWDKNWTPFLFWEKILLIPMRYPLGIMGTVGNCALQKLYCPPPQAIMF